MDHKLGNKSSSLNKLKVYSDKEISYAMGSAVPVWEYLKISEEEYNKRQKIIEDAYKLSNESVETPLLPDDFIHSDR